MTFDELALDLINKTNGFTELNGAYKVVSKADVQNAETILRTYYQNVDKKKLDYTNNDAEGIDYVIRFDTPLYNFDLEESIKMNEDYVIKPTYRTKGVTREDVEKYAELLGLDYETALRRWKRIQAPESNYERVLDRLEPVDEAIEKHDTLNPKLWDENNELKPEVRKKIEEIVQKFDDNLKENDVELDVKDICIIGSNANYNYSPDSDVDIHIIADTSVYPNQEDLAMKVYLAYKSLFNNKYDPMLNGIEAEVYVEPDAVKANSNGIYSLNQGWLKEPEQVDVPDIDPEHVQELVKPFEDRYNEVKVNPTIEDVDELIDDIYLQRQKSIMNDGEFGDGNICFKEFRNRGYLQDLRDLKVELENEEMSLNTFGEGVTRVFDLNDNELDLNEDIDVQPGQIYENGPEHTIEILSVDDGNVKYKERSGDEEFEDTEYAPRMASMLSEFDFKLAESKECNEDITEYPNGLEFSFPDPKTTLEVYLQWEGIIGYDWQIIEAYEEGGYDGLSDYLDEEGIYGYTEHIRDILEGEPAYCSQMEMEDLESICRHSYISIEDAMVESVNEEKKDFNSLGAAKEYVEEHDEDWDDDFDELLGEGDYLGSKRDLTRDEKKMYLRSIPKFRVIPHPGNHIHKKPFTVQSGRHYQTVDDVYKDYPKDEYDVELVEDIVKLKNGKWANKGKEGTHGEVKTKKAAREQQKAMFANGYHEDLNEDIDQQTKKLVSSAHSGYELMELIGTRDDIAYELHKEGIISDDVYSDFNSIIGGMTDDEYEMGYYESLDEGWSENRELLSNLHNFGPIAKGAYNFNDLVASINKRKSLSSSEAKIVELIKKMASEIRDDIPIKEGLDEAASNLIYRQVYRDAKAYDLKEFADKYNLSIETAEKVLKSIKLGLDWYKYFEDQEDNIDWNDVDESLSDDEFDSFLQSEGSQGDSDKLGTAFVTEFERLGKDADDLDIYDSYSDMYKDLDSQGREKISKLAKELDEADEVDIKAKALASNLGIDVSDVEQVDDCTYEADEGEYRVCTEEEAYKYAVEDIKGVFEDMGIQAFTPNFQKWILNNAIDMNAVNGIIDDEIDYFENSEDDPEMLEYLRGLNNDDDKVQFIKDLYGDSFSIWAKDYIDIDKVAEEAIKEDGVAHFVAYYDDDEVDLGNGLYAYRID